MELLCRAPGFRINRPQLDLRHNWHPGEVTHYPSLSYFNDAAAWEFIADCFRSGVPIAHKATVEHGDDCYIMIAAQQGDDRRIYMKVAINEKMGKKLCGISFHYERDI